MELDSEAVFTLVTMNDTIKHPLGQVHRKCRRLMRLSCDTNFKHIYIEGHD